MTASAVARLRDRVRRSTGILALLLALGLMGGFYAAFAPTAASAQEGTSSDVAARDGAKLFAQGCATCHGRNAQGLKDKGPSLIGVGASAVEFQVSSGRMPMARQEAQARRKPPKYSADETKQLAAYIESIGGGPQVPDGDLRDGDLAQGGRLFRTNCASCHGFSTNGGALSSGKFAPSLEEATDRQIYAAMQTGPQNMPVFGDNQLTPQEKQDIVKFVQSIKAEKDPGGMGIGRTGPVPEGLVIFIVGMVVLLFAAVWIAGKS
jgi:ubiquinol-cytochrome c reductase cytochrome c subunit